jgi:thiamine-monophosphate kinase
MPAGLSEFALIDRFFTRPLPAGGVVVRGIGDDCAQLALAGETLVVTTDMLLAGRHFFADDDPAAIGHKALAVNLSDLAAAGAVPRAFFLAIALPRADEHWLGGFARGLFALADAHGCVLAGGDTTRTPQVAGADGPLTLCITALGTVPAGTALTRGGARPGDELWVSGALGEAALGLMHRLGQVVLEPEVAHACRQRLAWPQPRVALGQALRGVATSAIDVSDGLLGDLGHVLDRSGVGAQVHEAALPLGALGALADAPLCRRCALAGGDDYELLFTAAQTQRAAVQAAGLRAGVPVSCIGRVTAQPGLLVLDAAGHPVDTAAVGLAAFDHFAR